MIIIFVEFIDKLINYLINCACLNIYTFMVEKKKTTYFEVLLYLELYNILDILGCDEIDGDVGHPRRLRDKLNQEVGPTPGHTSVC